MEFGTSFLILVVFAVSFTLINVFLWAIYSKWNPIWIAGLSTVALGGIFLAALAYKSLTEDDDQPLIFKGSENFETCDVVCGGAEKCVFSYDDTGVPETCNFVNNQDDQYTRGCACLTIPNEDLSKFNMDPNPYENQ